MFVKKSTQNYREANRKPWGGDHVQTEPFAQHRTP
jgi:hypothetical protein